MSNYAVTFILQGVLGPETNTMHHQSIEEVRNWAKLHNYVLGKPQVHVPTYSVEHADGSPLTLEERQRLQPEQSGELYSHRLDEVRLPTFRRPEFGLYDGAATAAMNSSGLLKVVKNG